MSGPLSVKRVVCVMASVSRGDGQLDAAADVAAAFQARLDGLLVEDTDLLQVAGLPFAREVAMASAAFLALDVPRVERLLRLRARQAAQSLLRAGRRWDISADLRIVRGPWQREVPGAGGAGDVLALERGAAGSRSWTALQTTLSASACAGVMWGGWREPPRALALLHGPGGPGWRALQAAARLAQAWRLPLTVYTTGLAPAEHTILEEVAVTVAPVERLPCSRGPLLVAPGEGVDSARLRRLLACAGSVLLIH
ncbi:MAG TPA: hypothetical protein ENJ19_11640 [Gammaproteobacteria bacterium]|nr:hypothetical protein [Gammaproteobacteria bacterium]